MSVPNISNLINSSILNINNNLLVDNILNDWNISSLKSQFPVTKSLPENQPSKPLEELLSSLERINKQIKLVETKFNSDDSLRIWIGMLICEKAENMGVEGKKHKNKLIDQLKTISSENPQPEFEIDLQAFFSDWNVGLRFCFLHLLKYPDLLDVKVEEILVPILKEKHQEILSTIQNIFPYIIVNGSYKLHEVITVSVILNISEYSENERLQILNVCRFLFDPFSGETTDEILSLGKHTHASVRFFNRILSFIPEINKASYLLCKFKASQLGIIQKLPDEKLHLDCLYQNWLTYTKFIHSQLLQYKEELEELLERSVDATLQQSNALKKNKKDEFVIVNKKQVRKFVEQSESAAATKKINSTIDFFNKIFLKQFNTITAWMDDVKDDSQAHTYMVGLLFKKMADKLSRPIADVLNNLQDRLSKLEMVSNQSLSGKLVSELLGTTDLDDDYKRLEVEMRSNKQLIAYLKGFQFFSNEINIQLSYPALIPSTLNETNDQGIAPELLIELSEQKSVTSFKRPRSPEKKNEEKKEEKVQPIAERSSPKLIPVNQQDNSIILFKHKFETFKDIEKKAVGILSEPLAPFLDQLNRSLKAEFNSIVDPSVLQEVTQHAFLAIQGVEFYLLLATQKKNPAFAFHCFMIDVVVCLEQFLVAKIIKQGIEPTMKHSLVDLAQQTGIAFTANQKNLFKTFDQALLIARYPEQYEDMILYPLLKKLNGKPSEVDVQKGFHLMLDSLNGFCTLLLDSNCAELLKEFGQLKDIKFEKGQPLMTKHFQKQREKLNHMIKNSHKTIKPLKSASTLLSYIDVAFALGEDEQLSQETLAFYLVRGMLHTDKLFKHLCDALFQLHDLQPIYSHSLSAYFSILKTINVNPIDKNGVVLLKSLNVGIAHHYHTQGQSELKQVMTSLLDGAVIGNSSLEKEKKVFLEQLKANLFTALSVLFPLLLNEVDGTKPPKPLMIIKS